MFQCRLHESALRPVECELTCISLFPFIGVCVWFWVCQKGLVRTFLSVVLFSIVLCVFAGFSVTSTVCLNPNWELVRCVYILVFLGGGGCMWMCETLEHICVSSNLVADGL